MRSKNEPETQPRSAMDGAVNPPSVNLFHSRKSEMTRKLFSRRGLATSESAAELEALRSASSSVASLVSATSVLLSLATSARRSAGRAGLVRGATLTWARLGTRGAFERRRHDLGGKVEEVTEILDSLIRQVPVVVSPGELLGDHTLGFQGLASLDDVKVGNALQLLMFGRKVILLGDHDSLLEEVLVNGDSVLFGHQHFRF